MNPLNVLLLSPYYSGSHQAWAAAWLAHTAHRVTVLSLPGRFWKWRMQGGAVTLARRFNELNSSPDVIVADDMVDLGTFLALTRRKTAAVPVVIYMHENQLTYPLPEDPRAGPMRHNWGVRERAYGLINWKGMLAADEIWFNSAFHRHSWFEALPRFLNHYPEEKELDSIPLLHKKSDVMAIGVEPPTCPQPRPEKKEPPLIIWNQRWEFDKNPAGFIDALVQIHSRGIPFRLALCGERFQLDSQPLREAHERFEEAIIFSGFAERARYETLLWEADITVSTAFHEFFGIGIVEAMMAHTMPIVPNRLSYPEVVPAELHQRCLYNTSVDLVQRLTWALTQPIKRQHQGDLAGELSVRFAADFITVQFDQKLAGVTRSS